MFSLNGGKLDFLRVGDGVGDRDDVGVERLGVDKSLSPLLSPMFKPDC